jgi:SAM-dependent methyltransferase
MINTIKLSELNYMEEQLYQQKDAIYFGRERKEILPLLPQKVDKILEVGCGSGATLAYLKDNGYCQWTAGIELFPEAAKIAKERLDFLYEGNVESARLPFEKSSFDVILCLDVLEHLVNPEAVVSYLHTLLVPGGVIIASIPNVRHISVVFPLVFMGRWNYESSGILDKTHLKFFVRDSAIKLMESSGLKLERVISVMGSRGSFAAKLSLSILKSFFEIQYLIKVNRVD